MDCDTTGTLTVRSGEAHWSNTEACIPFTLGVWADHDAVVEVVASDEVHVSSRDSHGCVSRRMI